MWRRKPSWAAFGTEDRAFDQAMLKHMVERAGFDITTVPGSDAVYLTQADAVTDGPRWLHPRRAEEGRASIPR